MLKIIYAPGCGRVLPAGAIASRSMLRTPPQTTHTDLPQRSTHVTVTDESHMHWVSQYMQPDLSAGSHTSHDCTALLTFRPERAIEQSQIEPRLHLAGARVDH